MAKGCRLNKMKTIMPRPNIVLLLADDMGYGDISHYGTSRFATPNMDYAASRGMTFTDMHSASAVCTPSRYSLLTGRFCWRTWLDRFVLGGFGAPLIEPRRLTLASMLKGAGYRTAAVGKWHLGLEWYTRNGAPLSESDRDGWNTDGFDVHYERGFGGGPCTLGFDSWFGIAGSLDMPPYCYLQNDSVPSVPKREKPAYHPQQRRGLAAEGFDDYRVDLDFADRAEEIIDRHAAFGSGEPLFLYFATPAPHRPCLPPDWLEGRSGAGNRGDMVLMVDHIVGRFTAALGRSRMLEDTIFIVTSDNGGRLTNYDGRDYGHKTNGSLRGQKGDIYDGGHREPFLLMWPRAVAPGSRCDELLSLTDIMATCAQLIGVPLPADAAEDSFSFLELLQGRAPDKPVHEAVIHHSLDGMFAVRTGPWKAVFGTGSGGFSEPRRYTPAEGEPEGQLFNIIDDTRETNNLWNNRPDIVNRLKGILDRYRREGRSRPA